MKNVNFGSFTACQDVPDFFTNHWPNWRDAKTAKELDLSVKNVVMVSVHKRRVELVTASSNLHLKILGFLTCTVLYEYKSLRSTGLHNLFKRLFIQKASFSIMRNSLGCSIKQIISKKIRLYDFPQVYLNVKTFC